MGPVYGVAIKRARCLTWRHMSQGVELYLMASQSNMPGASPETSSFELLSEFIHANLLRGKHEDIALVDEARQALCQPLELGALLHHSCHLHMKEYDKVNAVSRPLTHQSGKWHLKEQIMGPQAEALSMHCPVDRSALIFCR